jgi:hypothetical protein
MQKQGDLQYSKSSWHLFWNKTKQLFNACINYFQ